MTSEERNAASEHVRERLTREVTAFGTWGEFEAAMKAGYVPTIKVKKLSRRASEESRWNAACAEVLTALVRAAGFKVYDGTTSR